MATRTAALAVDVSSDVADAVNGLGDVGQASKGAGIDVSQMGKDAEEAARRLNITADSADELGGKAGKATGALGALSSGFELMGPSGTAAATALQSAALATDFLSGVGDSLNLVMESTIVQNLKQRAATIASTVATNAQAAATWALNAAMNANPIALVVIAVLALVAGLVLAYKKSETFRNIVNAAFGAVKNTAVDAFNWIKNNWPLLLAIITGPIGLAVFTVVKKWDDIRAAVSATKKWITDRMGEIPGALAAIGKRIKDAMLAPFEAIAATVQHILDLIGKIKVPKLPDLNPFSRVIVSGGNSSDDQPPPPPGTPPPPPVVFNIEVNGLVGNGDEIVRQIVAGINSRSRIFGGVVT